MIERSQKLRSIGPSWALLAVAGAAAWAVTLDQARSMGAAPGTMGMTFPFFVGVWVAMMAAMMLPALGPAATRRSRSVGRVFAFGAGFLVPWAAYGAAAFAALAAASRLVDSSPTSARWLGVGIFAAAGMYQLSPWKVRAIKHCRMPDHDGSPGIAGGFVAGVNDGAVCVGCCWALMAILIAMGAMNVAVMAGLAAVIFGEKVLPRPRLIATLAGVAFVVLAVVAAFHPSILHGLTPMEMGTQMPVMGGM